MTLFWQERNIKYLETRRFVNGNSFFSSVTFKATVDHAMKTLCLKD